MNFISVAHAGVITDATPISQVGMNVLFFLLSVAGIIAIIALVFSGIMYFSAIGDEKKMQSAKRTAMSAVWGITLALGSMVLVRFIGQFFSAQ